MEKNLVTEVIQQKAQNGLDIENESRGVGWDSAKFYLLPVFLINSMRVIPASLNNAS